MATFDAPSRESFCVGRSRSNTPLQALALMNDVQHFEAARAPTPAEQKVLAKALAAQRRHFEQNAEAASQVLANGESKASAALPVGEFAAWTMVANLLLNLDDAIMRN